MVRFNFWTIAYEGERLAAIKRVRQHCQCCNMAGSMNGVSMPELAFRVQHVSFSYNSVPALHDLSLQILSGERIALIGANGSGKSTLLRLLAGLSFPNEGSISFFDEALTEAGLQEESFFSFPSTSRCGFSKPRCSAIQPSVFDEVAFGPLQLRWPRDQIRQRVETTLSAWASRI